MSYFPFCHSRNGWTNTRCNVAYTEYLQAEELGSKRGQLFCLQLFSVCNVACTEYLQAEDLDSKGGQLFCLQLFSVCNVACTEYLQAEDLDSKGGQLFCLQLFSVCNVAYTEYLQAEELGSKGGQLFCLQLFSVRNITLSACPSNSLVTEGGVGHNCNGSNLKQAVIILRYSLCCWRHLVVVIVIHHQLSIMRITTHNVSLTEGGLRGRAEGGGRRQG